ncbi:MAG: hypothetical protein Q8P92_01500 [Candidatus Daviesbacteria bacterium]|nr:hypothetical protein [Candidatus Daviesbacteria bacterium]
MAITQELVEEINKIKERNRRVETEKAWETFWTRRIVVAVLTYLVISSFFLFAGVSQPFTGAIVPALAFVLSTASVPIFKSFWLRYINKK